MIHARVFIKGLGVAIIYLIVTVCGSVLMAQVTRPGTLQGQVTDSTGGSVEGASVVLTTPSGETVGRTTNASGVFEIPDLTPGNYTLSITMTGFAPSQDSVQIIAGQVRQLTVSLAVASQAQEVTVEELAPTVDASPSANASAVVMTGADLQALSDDPDQLMADLQALAGAAGPSGGQIFIDGFEGGQLPPKSSIREVRINSNPFAAEYDRVGRGRIEILTRPGTSTLRGRLGIRGNNSGMNTWSPFVAVGNRQPYYSIGYDGSLNGSINQKTSFDFSAQRRNINEAEIVNAIILDNNFNPVPFNTGIGVPQTRTMIRPRVDYQVSPNNTLTVAYFYSRDVRSNVGVGGFNLPTQAYDRQGAEHSIRVSDTQILGERVVNETRLEYETEQEDQTAQNPAATIQVNGAFNGGGSNRASSSTNHQYEAQNYTSIVAGPHMVRFGIRMRMNQVIDTSRNNFLGTFTFRSIDAYQLTQQGLAASQTMAQIRANGGGPSQFTVNAGTPRAVASVFDTGLFVQDDWRLRPNITLSAGLRFETQTNVPDHYDVAPRIGVAWAIGQGNRPTVVRAGYGLFYNRFQEGGVLDLVRLNGVTQQQFTVIDPDFYLSTIPSTASLTGLQSSPTVYSIAQNYRSPYIMQAALTVERQVSRVVNVSVDYLNSRGVHALITNNINAPLPGSITPVNPEGIRPFGSLINMYQYQTGGSFRQNQLIPSVNIRAGARLSLFANYTLNYSRQDSTMSGSPMNPYDLRVDAGRASNDIRHRLNVGGSMSLPWEMRLSPLITMQSGQPYNFTSGEDNNLDSRFNDRPAFADATTLPENLVVTPLGNFDVAPAPGRSLVPVNFGTGPSRFAVNMRLTKAFTFGGSGGGAAGGGGNFGGGGGFGGGQGGPPGGFGGGRPPNVGGGGGAGGRGRYTLTFNVDARNVFNIVNRGNPNGNVTSPLFGIPNQLAGGSFSTGAAVRRVELSMAFSF